VVLPTEGLLAPKPVDPATFAATHTTLLAALYQRLGASPRAMALAAPQVRQLYKVRPCHIFI